MSLKLIGSVAGRMLIGYLLFKVYATLRAEASALKPSISDTDDICTSEGLRRFLATAMDRDEIETVYQHCRADFLDRNSVSDSVKSTVDAWIGTDLSRAETNQIFLIYELALTAPKPENVSAQFVEDCRKMEASFQQYCDTIEPLTDQIEINLSSLLMNGPEEIDNYERDLFNFVQYSQFCRSLLDEASNSNPSESYPNLHEDDD